MTSPVRLGTYFGMSILGLFLVLEVLSNFVHYSFIVVVYFSSLYAVTDGIISNT